MRLKTTQLLAASAALVLTAGSASAVPIYEDDFDGGSGDINTLAPDTGANNWVASDIFNADGSVDRGAAASQFPGSMTLAFTPVDGLVYTLDASISGISGDSDWFGFGFANGQSDASSNSARFIGGDVAGTAWMLFRGDNADPIFNVTQLGTGVLGAGNTGLGATNWAALGAEEGGDIDMRIVLDTTGGAGTWTATWYAKRSNVGTYSEVGASTLVGNEANFTSVGIAASNSSSDNGTGGTVEYFSLTSVPEPSSLALLGLGGLLIARRRRSA